MIPFTPAGAAADSVAISYKQNAQSSANSTTLSPAGDQIARSLALALGLRCAWQGVVVLVCVDGRVRGIEWRGGRVVGKGGVS